MNPTYSDVSVGDGLPVLDHDVTATTVVLGALASRDWRPMHHDFAFANERSGVRDIFLNTPNQAAWFERCITDWSGPRGRIGRMQFRMHASVFPGDHMELSAFVTEVAVDDTGQGWVTLDIRLTVDETVCTSCTARVALPADAEDNPWNRRGDRWQP